MTTISRLTALLLGLWIGSAQAVLTAGDARFQERVTVDGRELVAVGAGVAKYRVVFTVYGAALYVPPGTGAAAVLDGETPRRLVIEYFHEIPPEDITRAADTVLERQLDDAGMAALRERIDRLHGWYRTVQPGDRYALTYEPGRGTTLRFNDEVVGTVEGADFAAAYFGIWLGDDPLSDGLRRDLLTGLENP